MSEHPIYKMSVGKVYPAYVNKAKRKGRTQAEVDEIIMWLTGYSTAEFKKHLQAMTDFKTFFAGAPKLNPKVKFITGVVCGVRVEDVKHPLMRKIRYLDKLIDELAAGRVMEKILREDGSASAKPLAKKKAAVQKKVAKKKAKTKSTKKSSLKSK